MEEPVARATFLGLPLELRNSIYEILLTSADPLNIAIPEPKHIKPGMKPQSHIELVRPLGKQSLVGVVSLLQVSKLIYEEARAILYANNIFLFMEPQALRIFACYVRDNKAKLRNVRLHVGRMRTTRTALKALYPTPNMQSLDLGRMFIKTDNYHMMVQLHGDEGLREASVAFADAGLTVDECERRFAATRLCAIMRGSDEWKVILD